MRATSRFFNNYAYGPSQKMLDDLVVESISIFGQDMYYCPRVLNNYDPVYGADDQSSYTKAIMLPIYLESATEFSGDGTFMAKFGIEVRNRITLSVARTVFSELVQSNTGQVRPNEGDLIYFPLNGRCFQIKYVEKFETLYPLGALYTWKMQCELFEYSGESLATGITEIDSLQTKFDMVVSDWAILTETLAGITTEDGSYITVEQDATTRIAGDDTFRIESESDSFIDFSVTDPFSEGNI